jgi:hypothetical protein
VKNTYRSRYCAVGTERTTSASPYPSTALEPDMYSRSKNG